MTKKSKVQIAKDMAKVLSLFIGITLLLVWIFT